MDGGGAEGGVVIVGDSPGKGNEVGDVFVTVVENVGRFARDGMGNKRAGGDGFRGIPDVGVEEGVVCATELLDAEVVIVDEALKRFLAILHRAHFDAAAHAVKGHGDYCVAGLPTDGAVLGVIGDGPNAGFGLDEGLIAIVVVLGREVVDGSVLVEVVGRVGFALGGGTVSDVIVGIGNIVCGNELVSNVVTVLFVVLRCAATEEVIGVDVSGISGVCNSGEEVAMGFVTPRDHIFVGIREGRFEVRPWQIRPLEAIGFRNAPRGGIIDNGLFPLVVHAVTHVPAEDVVVAGEGLRIEARDLLGGERTIGVVGKGGGAGGVGGGGLASHGVVGVGDVGGGVGVVDGKELAPVVVSISRDDAAGVGTGGEAAGVGVGIGEFISGD